jgi:DNA-binding FadR family transcriptional regulator
LLLESLADIMVQLREIGFRVPKTPSQAMQQHHLIFDCIAAGDVAAARQAMETHLRNAERVIWEGLTNREQAEQQRKP